MIEHQIRINNFNNQLQIANKIVLEVFKLIFSFLIYQKAKLQILKYSIKIQKKIVQIIVKKIYLTILKEIIKKYIL
jgi:hypothetical protein